MEHLPMYSVCQLHRYTNSFILMRPEEEGIPNFRNMAVVTLLSFNFYIMKLVRNVAYN